VNLSASLQVPRSINEQGIASSPNVDRRSGPALKVSTPNTVLAIRSLSKRFGRFTALEQVDFDVRANEIHCLLGENGAGKSTLCNIIFGVHEPTGGHLELFGAPFRPRDPAHALTLGVAMVHQHFSLVGNLTALENVQLGRVKGRLSNSDLEARLAKLGHKYGLGVPLHRPVEQLSIGERQRVEILKCLLAEPRLLVLDEPTAVLPPTEVEALLAICRNVAAGGCGVLLVTHKLAEIAAVAHRTTVLRRGRTVCTVQMAKANVNDLVQALAGRQPTPLQSLRSHSGAGRYGHASEDALRVEDLVVQDDNGVNVLDASLSVAKGEVVGLAGVEGNGQTQLGAVLAGLLRPSSGQVRLGERHITGLHPRLLTKLGVGVVPEDRHAAGCHLSLSVAENLFLPELGRFSRFGLLQRRRLYQEATTRLTAFDVRGLASQRMSELSGGNQQKVVLARELSLSPLRFLLAAQPTRGLDLGAVEAVYTEIRRAAHAGAGVLLLSSELDELLAVCDRVLVMYRGRIVGETKAGLQHHRRVGEWMSGHRVEDYGD